MTPLGCSFERFASLLFGRPTPFGRATLFGRPRFFGRPSLLAVALLVPALAPPVWAAPAVRTARATIAYVPGAIWGPYLDAAAGELNLDRSAIYWFDGSDAMGRLIGDRERYEATDAKAAPREALVAFVGRFAVYPANKLVAGVAVMDTTGVMVADFPGATGYAWSPDGSRLAVVFPKEALRAPARRGAKAAAAKKSPPRYRPGVVIWDRENGGTRSVSVWPSRACWAGDDSLLVQLPDRVGVIPARRAVLVSSSHRGTILSPDAGYALWPGEGGRNTEVYHESTGVALTSDLFDPFRRGDRGQIRSAFWIRAKGATHLMCISACDGIQQERPSCRTEIIDVETRQTVDSFSGEALGPTADERGVVVFRRGRGRLEFHDLRPVAREWASALRESHGDALSGGVSSGGAGRIETSNGVRGETRSDDRSEILSDDQGRVILTPEEPKEPKDPKRTREREKTREPEPTREPESDDDPGTFY